MSQSKIFIDIGNSAIKWRTPDSKVYSEKVSNFRSNTLTQADSAWVSVVANSNIVDDIKTLFKEFNLVNSQKKCNNLVLAYDDSSSLGSDRFCAMLGAMNHFPQKPLLLIDVGSAMTFDIIDVTGLHQGGLIMPGLASLRKSFTKFETSDLSVLDNGLASDTVNAWKNGTQAMLLSAIKIQIDRFQDKYTDGVVAICGGTVDEIKSQLPKSIQIFDNLVLDGLECYSQTVG
jgi:type III pantothenate kinase